MHDSSKAQGTPTGTGGRLSPIVRELPADVETPISVYLKLRGLGPSFLLESVEGGEHLARYSIIGTRPRGVITAWPGRVTLEVEGDWRELQTGAGGPRDILDVLRDYLGRFVAVDAAGLPRFTGGAVGYMGYDLVRSFERLPASLPDPLGLPEAVFLLSDVLVVYDHVRHRLLAVAHADPDAPASRQEAESALDEMEARLRRPLPNGAGSLDGPVAAAETFVAESSREEYMAAVERARENIAAGDIFQVVLSRRMSRRTHAAPFDIYRALRRVNPSPYMFYLELPDGLRLIGSSPEVLVRLENGLVETRPLAGTRRRGSDPEEDRSLAAELLADPKERAEHVMLVDLARNDVGRVARFGSVTAPTMMDVEYYSHVMHIVSLVQGRLAPGKNAADVLRACFPAGTVSGAPKVRAMEIIEELEPARRGPYAGAVGYFDYRGNMDTCITIRTMVMRGDRVYLQAGAGIVADSNPAREYEETENKLGALAQALLLAEESAGKGGVS